MQVYNALFRIIKKNFPELMIYIFIFLLFAVFLASQGDAATNINFSETKTNVVFINEDKGSYFIDGLKKHLSEYAKFIKIEDNEKKLQDALFYRKTECIIRVPKGFTEGFLKGEDVKITKTTVPDSTTALYIENVLNKYLNTAKIYIRNVDGLNNKSLADYVANDLKNKTEVNIKSFGKTTSTGDYALFYFNYLSYSIFSIIILGVCAVMLIFNNKDLKMRNYCSPLKARSINLQLITGNLSFAFLSWLILVATSFILYKDYMFSLNALLFLLNSLIFSIAALSIAFLLSNLLKSRGAISAAANVVSLGTSFISGVFVPQYMLSKTVLNIASFTPTYWYIKANNSIAELVSFDFKNILPIFGCMLIVLCFGIAFLAVSLVIVKQKRQSI